MPPETSGLLVSGGSMANLVGLAVARDARENLALLAGEVVTLRDALRAGT